MAQLPLTEPQIGLRQLISSLSSFSPRVLLWGSLSCSWDHPLLFIFSGPLTQAIPFERWTRLPAGPLSTAPE